MVYVPQGDFQVGSGGTESGSFTNGSWSGTPGTTPTIPLSIASENALTIANTAGNLWGTSTTGISTIGYAGTLSATFPKGFQAFYCMKYEIMQQQYVDFLNTLTTLQASHRYSASSTGFRYGITLSGEVYSNTTTPYVACNYLNWADLAAYLDWSGLRPMTELEFEKSCRGTLAPVADEYAWGSTSITQNTGITRDGYYDETSENSGNCTYGTHSSVLCPMRVGAFATSSSTTSVLSGATYYGIMEMSGNLYERPVTIGNVAGRSFTGLHGDGTLNTSGDATVNYWPGINGNAISTNPNEVYGGTTGVTSAAGAGIRGGHWNTSEINLRVSDRSSAAEHPDINRWTEFGGRGVRTAP
jgi:formylglycine-generating enzyme required for sulfatase activity